MKRFGLELASLYSAVLAFSWLSSSLPLFSFAYLFACLFSRVLSWSKCLVLLIYVQRLDGLKAKRILHCLSATLICCFSLAIYSFYCFGRQNSPPTPPPPSSLSCTFFLSHSPFFFLIWQLHFFKISSQKRNTVQQTEMKRWNKFIGRFSCPCRREYLANTVADTDSLWLQMTIPINMTWQCQTTCCLKAELLHNRNGMKAQPEGSQTSVTFVESFMFLQSVTAQKKNMIV